MTSHWVKDLVRNDARPHPRLSHPTLTDSAFEWPSAQEKPVASYRVKSAAMALKHGTAADYLEAVNILEEFDDVENAALEERERFQDSRRRSPMLDEIEELEF